MLKALDHSGAAENTFVFFMSDNGAFRLNRKGLDVGSNFPLRHGGVTCWEGGLRVAAIARWPEHIPAGIVIDEPFWSPDLLVAALHIAGAELPNDVTLDGRNPLPILTGMQKSPHRSLFFSYGSHTAVRMGDWKLVREDPRKPWQLFNLSSDPSEKKECSESHPKRIAELQEEWERWQNSIQRDHRNPGREQKCERTPVRWSPKPSGNDLIHSQRRTFRKYCAYSSPKDR